MDTLKFILVPINRAGWPFIGGCLIAAVILFFVWQPLGWLALVLAGFCTFFFRDPDRVVPAREGLVVSAADGICSAVDQAPPPPELGMAPEPLARVSVFLSVFDVHINRMPADGTVSGLAYTKGRFVNAISDKASEDNERQAIALDLPDGRKIAVVQIAGLVARRIVCGLHEGQRVRAGERFGLIRFGSRTDVYLPPGVAPLVAPGQRMIGGETVIADLRAEEGPRRGEVR